MFDVVFVSVKAYSLARAVDDFAPGVGPGTAIVPLLNGIAHLDALSARFGTERVLGGTCLFTATLDAQGRVLHLLPKHDVTFGELGGGRSERAERIEGLFAAANCDGRASDNILLEMWEKLVLLATNAGATSLMRASIGDILASAGGRDFLLSLLEECRSVAVRVGYAPRAAFMEFSQDLLTTEGSEVKASMLRDIERGGPTEGEHILAYMDELARKHGVNAPLLGVARCHVAAYERQRLAAIAG
jgi:2-dehydropantoate 2-reductase